MHVGVVKFLKQESNRTGRKILMACLLAVLANGLIIVVLKEASQNYAALNFRCLIIFVLSVLILALTRHYTHSRKATIAREAPTKTNLRIADKIRCSNLAVFEIDEEVISGLKRQGKVIISVTHDDLHFQAAGRFLKMGLSRCLGERAIGWVSGRDGTG